MTERRFTLPTAVFSFLIKDGHTLLLRRRNTGWHDGDYDLPAGHINGDESFIQAMCREAKEEIGITVQPQDAAFVHLTHAIFENHSEYLNVFFEVKTWTGEPTIMEPNLADRLQWFPLTDLPKNLAPGSQMGLAGYLKHRFYTEAGFPSNSD